MTMGVGNGDALGQAFWLAGKRGKIVVTNIHPALEMSATVSLLDLTLMEKQVVGSLFGSGNPRAATSRSCSSCTPRVSSTSTVSSRARTRSRESTTATPT